MLELYIELNLGTALVLNKDVIHGLHYCCVTSLVNLQVCKVKMWTTLAESFGQQIQQLMLKIFFNKMDVSTDSVVRCI